jgi:phosphoribosylformylglycinamidine synthase
VADPQAHLPVYRALAKTLSGRALRSIHDLSDGGLAVAAAESCLGGRLGAELRLDAMPRRQSPGAGGAAGDPGYPEAASLLFAEDTGRFLVSIRAEDRERFETSMAGLPAALVGEVVAKPRLTASLRGKKVLDASLVELERAFKTPIA